MAIGVGVIGAGTVGGGVIHTLLSHGELINARAQEEIRLVHVADVEPKRLSEFDLNGIAVSDDAEALINDPRVDVVCELIGGLRPAKSFILSALNAKKNVVTANKMLLAYHGSELNATAIENAVELRYEAAVAGGIPIIKALREGLAGNQIQYVYGILNGTCNYILTRMTYEGLEFDEVLRLAIANGFAETPPDLDIQGHDTAHKCQIIASLCFFTEVDLRQVPVEGVTKVTHADVAYAREMGYLIKLLAIVRDHGEDIEAAVHPMLIREDHLLANVRHEFNAVYVQADGADATLYYGRGAGRMPTASAVVGDIVDIARRDGAPAPPPFIYGEKRPLIDRNKLRGRYYIRLTTLDNPGVLGAVCTTLGDFGVSISSCIQKEEHEENAVHVVLMTHETMEHAVYEAAAAIDEAEYTREPSQILRVL